MANQHAHAHSNRHHVLEWLLSILHIDGHSHATLNTDKAFLANQSGIRTVWISLAILLVTALLQLYILYFSGSVALLADTAHNLGDGLNSIPLLIAFYLGKKAANRAYTYGYGRAEDIAGIFIVLSIAVSAGIVLWETFEKLINPQPIWHPGWLAFAGFIGFLGNEFVAIIQIKVGKHIGSAALVLDGLHARTDGLTSLAVVLAAAGAWLGVEILDPIIGFGIGIAIVIIAIAATKTIWQRLMDAVDPALLVRTETLVKRFPQIEALQRVRMRWVGQNLCAEMSVLINSDRTLTESNAIIQNLTSHLQENIENLSDVVVQIHPAENL